MALTTGINQLYASTWRTLPQKALPLGTPSATYESVMPYDTKAGNTFLVYGQVVIPVGFGWASTTNYDFVNLGLVGGNAPNFANATVNPGYRMRRLFIRSSGNAGGTVTSLVGFATANNLYNATANTSGYLGGAALAGTPLIGATGNTLQVATPLVSDDVPSGTGANAVYSVPVLNAQDSLILCPSNGGAQATTTAVTVEFRAEYYLTGPTGY